METGRRKDKRGLGFYSCIVMVPAFWILALIFGIFKERAAKLLSGFNTLPEYEQEQYDRAWMARDERNNFLLWGGIMLAGAAGSLVWPYAAVPAYCLWLILFFKGVRLDARKAFQKYKK